jgi:hypothetical protein
MYDYFKNAPVLGSLLDPSQFRHYELLATWEQIEDAIKQAFNLEKTTEWQETAIAVQGFTKAAELLSGKYNWIITNPPYLARSKQDELLKIFLENNFQRSKNDIATSLLEKYLKCCVKNGTISMVLPQNWLFLTTYKHLREKLLNNETWKIIIRLGAGAFETISGEIVKTILLILSHGKNSNKYSSVKTDKRLNLIYGLDASGFSQPAEKSKAMKMNAFQQVEQLRQLNNPDFRIALYDTDNDFLLSNQSNSYQGISPADFPRFGRFYWERSIYNINSWIFWQSTARERKHFSGCELMLWIEEVYKKVDLEGTAYIRGEETWGKNGIVISAMGELPCTLAKGHPSDTNVAILIPKDEFNLAAIWCYCSSLEYNEDVRQIDQSLKVTNATLVKVPFDLDYWTKVAAEKYPNGLPKPYSDDSTQWIFHGHPCGSVIWDETEKKTAQGKLRCDKTVLQIAAARLLGYQWPAEQDENMELAPEQREWVKCCAGLEQFADEDGIVPIPAMRGKQSAESRFMKILETAYGSSWTVDIYNQLLKDADCQGRTLEYWFRDKFFEQHCELFKQRPFIWQIWDGLKDGFSVLVNYHKLDSRLLDSLIYTYLGDWMARQEREKGSIEGAAARLDAAKTLQQKLILIQKGETPCDIFVRWKPLAEQPIGWNPDLNDGVRLNIRPFMSCGDIGKTGSGVLRIKPKIHWNNDRGKDVKSAPWYTLGKQDGVDEGTRINDHHLSLEEKRKALLQKQEAEGK